MADIGVFSPVFTWRDMGEILVSTAISVAGGITLWLFMEHITDGWELRKRWMLYLVIAAFCVCIIIHMFARLIQNYLAERDYMARHAYHNVMLFVQYPAEDDEGHLRQE